ncbi:class I SAM-dependent methyltransferase [Scatolibacter rhodanostii]|uniref:class I SAM-dependent methyltransferase n=1 Tax=Scatolibacter rhodanostii TaxID=2014781 RepID=UPI000C0893B1|nr:class I SAM-dependent methyltransferase [Scatolibacter rhodanostii]
MEKNAVSRTNIIGGGEVGQAVSIHMKKDTVHRANSLFWDTKGNDLLGTTALPHYGAFISEEKCQLLGDITGKKVLEIGCGTGHSLQYVGERKASELWGVDLSQEQIKKAEEHLTANGLSAKLVCSPMEEECGIPQNYFDIVYSVYAIGWTTDLEATFCRIASYLKKDGKFIFSWSHPIHKCVAVENDTLLFKKSYFDESWYSVTLGDSSLTLSDRKLSTYINVLAKAGFIMEELIEESDEDMLALREDDFAKKAKMLPATFVIKARKQ